MIEKFILAFGAVFILAATFLLSVLAIALLKDLFGIDLLKRWRDD